MCQSIRHCLWEAGCVPALSRIAPRAANSIIAATALDTLRAIFDDPLSRNVFCSDQGWEGAVREVMLNSCAPVALVAASRVVVTASPDVPSFYRMLNMCIPEAIVRMSTRVLDDAVIAAGSDALLAMGKRGRLVSIQLMNYDLVHPMADALGQVGWFFCIIFLWYVDFLSQVSHWGSKLAICRALGTLCAEAPFAQALFRTTGLATVINVIRSVSTTSGRNAYPSAPIAFAPASPLKTAKQTPSLTASGRVVGEVQG